MPVEVHKGATYSDEVSVFGLLLELLEPPAWHADAACKEHPEVDFFASDNRSIAQAKAVCRGCLVRGECQEWAGRQEFRLAGVWGGLTQMERQRLRPKRDVA